MPKMNSTEDTEACEPSNDNQVNLKQDVRSEVFVIQKYIERPLLLQGRKFDIRLWVLVNQVNLNEQRCYLFAEGYIRTSSQKFTLA